MRLLLNPYAAPSATLPAGAATPATPSAPVAPDFSTAPVNPVEFQKALTAELMQLAAPPKPEAALAQGSPAEPADSTATPAVPADATATAADPEQDAAQDAVDAAEAAGLGEAGHRALQAEREKRKAARAEVAALRQEIESLKNQLQPPAQIPANEPQNQPGQQPAPQPAPSVAPAELADCETFDAVDACAMRAVTTEAMAMRLNTVLATEGLQAVVEQFRSSGIENFRGLPLDELTPGQLAADLSNAMQNARTVQIQSTNRKQAIAATAKSFGSAVDIVPGLKDPRSEASRLFQSIVSANPAVKQLGPNWPQLVAKQILAEETLRARVKPPTAAFTPAPKSAQALPSGPGAPRTSTASVRNPSELETLSQKINSGQASAADMKQYGRLSLAQATPV